jgi:hypothetical protein
MPVRRRPFEALQSVLHHGDLSVCQLQQPPELKELLFLSSELAGCSVRRSVRVLFRRGELLPELLDLCRCCSRSRSRFWRLVLLLQVHHGLR